MNAPAAQPAPEQELPPEAPPAELTDEEIFEQAFEERYGPDAGDPAPAGEPSPDADPAPPPADAAGDPPPADPGDPPVGDPPPEQQAGSEPEPEAPAWYNELPDEAKEAFDQTSQDLASLQDQFTALHGRVAPVQQENARLREQLDSRRPAPAAEPQPDPSAPAPTDATPTLDLSTVEEFKEFEEAFPEEAKAIKAIFGRQAQHLTHLEGQLGEVSDGLRQVQTASSKSERESALNKLSEAHPDWMTVRPSEDFERWRQTQPPSVARMADSPNPDECIYILDRYKQDRYLQRQLDKRDNPDPAPPAEPPETSAARATRERRQQLRAVPGVDPQAGDVGIPQGDPEAMLSDEEIWEREVERRLRAQRDSRR